METELSDAEVTALVARNLKQHLLKPARLRGLRADEASDCRKQIIELIGLPRPKSIVIFIA